ATAEIASAATLDELDALRVKYLGRKSELKLALREIRDRETGMTLNALRERLEQAVAERLDRLGREKLEQALTGEAVDVTLPGEQLQVGHLHPTTHIRRIVEDSFLGLGYRIVDDREV